MLISLRENNNKKEKEDEVAEPLTHCTLCLTLELGTIEQFISSYAKLGISHINDFFFKLRKKIYITHNIFLPSLE